MDINDIDTMEDADIREELKSHGVNLHHKTSSVKLKATLKSVLEGTYEATETEKKEELPKVKYLTPEEHIKKLTKEQRAMRLVRIIVTPNDPLMANYHGLIFSVGSSAVNNGRMIKKYVPFNNEDGWHVPHIIYEQIKNAEMQKFRQVTRPNGEKTMEPYITKKFSVELLSPLNPEEMKELAATQAARGFM